ncbi:MAG: hypothetical protein ACR2GU_10800 [Rubrobacteraceae bacterium]
MRDEFMITRQGKQYVLFAGLLDEAHNRGLHGIDTELIQVPEESNGNVAVIKATVHMEDGRTFSGIGDASPSNVGRAIVPHLIRTAETRAKARALRDAVNVGATALEELSDGDDGGPPADYTTSRPGRDRNRSSTSAQSSVSPVRAVPRDAARKTGGDQRSRNSGQQEESRSSGPAPGEIEESNGQAHRPEESTGGSGRGSGRASSAKARKSQVDLLKTLAIEWRSENGVERLESRIGKPLTNLTRTEADEWIDRLTPEDRE